MRIVVEMRAACAVIKQPGTLVLGHASDEVGRVLAPFLVELRKNGDCHLLDVLALSPFLACTKHLLNGMFLIHSVRASE